MGRGPGPEIRAAIPPDPTLPYAALEPLLSIGTFARELVARHPALADAPLDVLEMLARDPKPEVRDQAEKTLRARSRT